jgi:hypothetical protein
MAFSTDDFSKVWASTSPLTPYEFSDSNYKQGWNFVGSTPPARQMWDFLQKQNDEKTQWLYSNKLSLSGGTMTGSIYNGVGTIIRRSDNTGFTQINAGTDDTSPYISMYGKDHTDSAGVINLRAINSTNDKRLQLNPNGSMTWGGVSLTDGTFLTAKTITVSARSGTSSYSITAPSVSGYQFVCWVMSASNGNVYPTYIASATNSSATVWAVNPTNNTSIACTALYVRKW